MRQRICVIAAWMLAFVLSAAGIWYIVNDTGGVRVSLPGELQSSPGNAGGIRNTEQTEEVWSDSRSAAVFPYQEKTIPVAFSWWGNDERHFYTLKGLNLFGEKNPGIQVSHKFGVWDGFEGKNRVYMKSKTNADVMQINYNWLEEFSPDGTGYYDLSKVKDEIELSGYKPADLQAGERGGVLNAIPIAYNSTVFFYNKSIYDRYGLPIPETWDDLFAAAERMRQDGIYPLGLMRKHLVQCLVAYYEQTSGRHMIEDGTISMEEEDVERILMFYKRLVEEKVIPIIDDFDAEDFTAGRVAGVGCWTSDASRYCEKLSERGSEVALGRKLVQKDGSTLYGWYIKPATMYAISATTKHPKEAAKLLNFLLNDSDMILLQGLEKGVPANQNARSVLREAGKLKGFEYQANINMMNDRSRVEVMVPLMENADLIDVFKKYGDEYLFGRQELSQSAEKILTEIRQIALAK
jgi:oligogalacturonide transport system substrate-binding protein